MIILYF